MLSGGPAMLLGARGAIAARFRSVYRAACREFQGALKGFEAAAVPYNGLGRDVEREFSFADELPD